MRLTKRKMGMPFEARIVLSLLVALACGCDESPLVVGADLTVNMDLAVGGLDGGLDAQVDLAPAADLGDAGAPDLTTGDAGPTTGDAGPTQAPSFRIDPEHTGGQPGDPLTPPLTQAWSVDVGGTADYALVANGRVFVVGAGGFATPTYLTALDRATGAVVWGPVSFSSPVTHAYDGGQVFALAGDGTLTAVDAVGGMQQWSVKLAGQISAFRSPPIATGGLIYIDAAGGTTYAVRETDGSVAWSKSSNGSDGAPAIASGVVFEVEPCTGIHTYDALSGTPGWSHAASCFGGGGQAPAVFAGRLYERDDNPPGTGNIFDATNGTVLGTFMASQPAAFEGGRGFYLSGQTLTAVTLSTATPVWSFSGPTGVDTSPVVANGYVYVGSILGTLYALDAATGAQVWMTYVGSNFVAAGEARSMAIAEGTLFVPVGSKLIAYH
jgi:outer membrane protein assembly factor BamB